MGPEGSGGIMRKLVAILLVAGSFAPLRASDPDSRDKEKARLQGTWATVALVDNGREETKDDVKRLKLTIKGDKYIYAVDGRTFEGTYTVDPAKKPKEMNVT